MKKYIYLFLYTSIFYAAEQNINNTPQLKPNKFVHTIDNMYKDNSQFKSISHTENTQAITINRNLINDFNATNSENILGKAIFQYMPLKRNFNTVSNEFSNNKISSLIKLLKKDFKTLQLCCNFDEENNMFNDLDNLDLNETSLKVDHEDDLIEISELESDGMGICITRKNFFNLMQTWKNCLHRKYPYLLLIQSLDNEYEIQPFHGKEGVDEYLTNHPIQK